MADTNTPDTLDCDDLDGRLAQLEDAVEALTAAVAALATTIAATADNQQAH